MLNLLFVTAASLVFGVLFLLLVIALAKRLRSGQMSRNAALLWALLGIFVIGAVFVGFMGITKYLQSL